MPLIPLDSEAEIQPVDSTGSGFAVGSIPQQQSQGSFLQPQDRASSQQPARLQPQGQNFLDDPFFVERSVEANKRTLRQMRRQAALIPLGEASPVAEPAPVATPETEYHWEGAAKQAGYGIARTMGANLPSAIGKTFDFINRAEPGDESSLTKIGEENKAQYDLWKKKSVDIQDLNKAIARHTESYLTQAVAQSGETLGALGINAVGTAAGSLVGMPWLGTALSAATFQDLNYEDVYNQAIEKGATPDAAKKAGYINGTIDSILDSLQLKALQSVFKPASKLTNFLWKLGATSLFTEGGLEGVQGVQETIGSEWAAKPKEETAAQFTQRMWDNRSELWQTFKDNAIPAAIMSAGIGVPGHIMGSMSNSQLVKGIKNGLENGKMTTDDVRTLLDSKLKDADESTKRKIEGLISKEKEDVATTEEPPLPEAPPEELIPLDEANVPDLELQPAPALSPQNVGIEIPSPESQTFIEGQPIIPQGVVQPSVNQEQVTSPDVSTQGAGQTPGIESSPVVLPQAGPQEGAPANVPGAQSVTEPLLNVAAPVQEEKTAKSGQAAGELTEDTKINGVTFRQLEDLIINDKPGIKKELEDIKGLHGRAGMQDLVNPGKLYARLRKRLVTEQGMTKDQAKDALQGPFKRYEQRFKEVEGGIENAESVRGNEGQIKTGRDVGQEGQGKGGEDLQLQEPEKASGQEGGINRKAFYSGIEIGKKELDIHRESKTGTETTYRYRPFKYQGAEYLAVQKNMPGARGPEFEVRAPTGHVVQNFKREGAKYNGTFNFAGINTLKDFYHKVSTLAQDDAVNFLDDYHYSQPTPKQSPTVAPEPQAAGGPGGVNQSKVAYYDTVFEEEAKTKYPHHISILNKITREDNFPTVWMTPPYKGKNHLGKVDITQGVIDVHPQMIERLAKKIAKYHDVTVNDVLPELYKEIIQHEQVHIKQQSDMRLPNKRISKNHPLEIEAYEQGNIRKAIDKIIETKKQSAHEESNPIPTNKEALRQKNLEKREAVRAAREKKGEGSIPQQDTTNLKGGVPNAKETSKANAEKGQSREAVPGFQVSAQAQKEKIERKARNAEQGETKLNLSDITLNNQTFSDNRKAVGQFRKWMRTAGLSKELLDKLDVEVKNTLKIIGNVRRSEAEHGRKLSDLGKAIGATTFFDDASVLVQFADNMNFIQAEDTAYHEAFHVMLNKLVSEENRTALLDHFKGNEEDAAKAFSKFVVNQETTSIPKPIRKIFYQIKKILTRIGNAFRQSGYKTPEDFFKAIYFGADLKGEDISSLTAKTSLQVKLEPRIDYIGDMEDANGNTFGLYNVFGVEGRADGSTVTENTLRKLELIPEGKGTETKLNIASTAKEFQTDMATATEDVVGFFKGLSQTKKIRAANKAMRKADTTAFDRYFATPFFSFRKVPAAWRMFEDGQKRDENFHTKVDELSKAGDGQYWTIKLAQAKRQIPEEFKKIWKIFKHLDQNAIGHKVEAGKDKGTFVLKDTKGKEVGVFPSENDAWEAATQRDLEALRKRGLSKQAVNAGEAIIRMRHAGFNLLSKNIREVIAKYEELGMDLPKYSVWQDGEKIVVDLKMELARLGDLRGYYMPHSWKPGRIIVYARREGAHGVIKKFDTEIMAANWERDMQGKGYKTESKISGPMPEDVFDMAGQTVAVNAMLNESLERLKKKDFTLAEFDLKGEFVEGPGKNKDFRLIGSTNKRQGQILKDMGGKWYQAKRDNVEHWHFMNKPSTFEKKLAKALALSSISGEVDKQTAMLFAGGLAEQLGNIIKERGARKHMIHRSGAKGIEVWEGYEEDPDLAMAQYVRSLAAGEAKHVMAVDMVKHMTGTDVSWSDYKTMIEEERKETPEYDEYLTFVKDRGIDAIEQPHIFKDASAYMKDMLRNQEAADRIIGMVKGLTVLKYLGFKLSALPINMSAMLTTVPASMKAYGDISIGKAFGHMARMSKMYVQYERYKRSNDASLLPQKYIDLFQEMEKKGYGKPQFNRETLATLESKMGRGYSRLIELSMTPFAISETFNRMVTISAAYEGLRAQGKSHEEALKIAKDVSDHAHAIYGKGNYPHILRGENLASQVLKCGYVFKQFNHNYLQAMWDMGYNKHDAKATMWMAASPIFLSGMGAFAGTALIKAALQALGADDPEEWFYNQVEENLGQKAGTVARVGLPGLVGVSLKGSLAIDLTGIPTKPAEFLGAPGSVIGDFWEGGKQLFKGNTSKGVEKLLPTVLASPVKAVREYTEGVTSSGNLPVYYGSKPLAPDMAESITRFLGFSPARIASAREKQWNERLIEQKYTERRSGIYARFHKYFLMPPEARSKAKYLDLLAEVSQYNNDLIKSGLTKKGYSPITPKLLRANIKRGFRPSKKEKLREER